MDSILDSVKRMLGIDEHYEAFDEEIIMNINAVFMILRQMGCGPASGFSITGNSEMWSDYISDISLLECIKPYVYQKVRSTWDPPSSSITMNALSSSIQELEWRIYCETNPTGAWG